MIFMEKAVQRTAVFICPQVVYWLSIYCTTPSSCTTVSSLKQLANESRVSISDESNCDVSESRRRPLPQLRHLKQTNKQTYINTLYYIHKCWPNTNKHKWFCSFEYFQTTQTWGFTGCDIWPTNKVKWQPYCCGQVFILSFLSFV